MLHYKSQQTQPSVLALTYTAPRHQPPFPGDHFFSLFAHVPNSLPRALQSTAPHLIPHLEDLPPFIPSANSLARASQTTLLDHKFCVRRKGDPRLFPKTHKRLPKPFPQLCIRYQSFHISQAGHNGKTKNR